jgi:hypothetical protein
MSSGKIVAIDGTWVRAKQAYVYATTVVPDSDLQKKIYNSSSGS